MNRSHHNTIRCRRAATSDRAFLVKAIIEADLSGTSKSSFGALLGLNRDGLTSLFMDIFELEINGFEFSENSFLIAECGEEAVGAFSCWIESLDGIASWQKRMLTFRELLSGDSYEHFTQMLSRSRGLMPSRTALTAQWESIYIVENYRGKGVLPIMWKAFESHINNVYPASHITQVITYSNNERAIRAYQKLGFAPAQYAQSADRSIMDVFPFHEMVLLEKTK